MENVIFDVFYNGKFVKAVYAANPESAIAAVAGENTAGFTATRRHTGADLSGA